MTKIIERLDRQRAGEIAEIAAVAGVPHLAAPWIREGISTATAQDRVAILGDIREAVSAAAALSRSIDPKLAEKYFAEGLCGDEVRTRLADSVAATPAALARTDAPADGDLSGWDAAFAKASADIPKTNYAGMWREAFGLASPASEGDAPSEAAGDVTTGWDKAFAAAEQRGR